MVRRVKDVNSDVLGGDGEGLDDKAFTPKYWNSKGYFRIGSEGRRRNRSVSGTGVTLVPGKLGGGSG